jgi:hypothetical protein
MADNLSSGDVVPVAENTSKAGQFNDDNAWKITVSNFCVGSGSDSVDQGESNSVTNLGAIEDSTSTPVANASPSSDHGAGLIPVGDGQVPASAVSRSVHFKPTPNEDDELLQTNLLKLLQPPAFHNFARPAIWTPRPPYNQQVITARETQEELFSVVEVSVPVAEPVELQAAQQGVSAANNGYEYSGPDRNTYDSAINRLPMPIREPQFMANDPEPFPLNNFSESIICTFGFMQSRGNGDRSLSFIPESFNAAEPSEFSLRFNTRATISTGLVFL